MMRPLNPGETDWTPALVEHLSALWLAGVTSGEIGRLMGISRSSVMGKLRRLNLLRNDHRPLLPRRMPAQKLLKNCSVLSRTKKVPHKRHLRRVTDFVTPPPPLPPPEPPIGEFGLLDLRARHCRWPGPEDRPPHTFCGAPRVGESSYCSEHHARSLSGSALRPVHFSLPRRAAA